MSREDILRQRCDALSKAAQNECEVSMEWQRRYLLAHDALVRIATDQRGDPCETARAALKALEGDAQSGS